MEIDKKLKNARMNANMTQEQAAEQINVSRQTISNWENGKSLPDVINLIKISDVYQMSLDTLLKGDGKMIEKIKKDTSTVKSNQTMMNVGWMLLFFSIIFSVWNNYLGDNIYLQFINAATPWVMLGVGIACVVVSSPKRSQMDA